MTPHRPGGGGDRRDHRGGDDRRPRFQDKPPLRVMTTTLWEYPSQHYERWLEDGQIKRSTLGRTQGSAKYEGATPSWIVWQLLMRYTRAGDTVLDPFCGSGTTLDVAHELGREGAGYDLTPSREDIVQADARTLPTRSASADFVFMDPPYSTHIEYSEDGSDIGNLSAAGEDGGAAYYDAMARVIGEAHRVLRDRRYMALYVSDSWKKRRGKAGGGGGVFMPIGFELYSILRERFEPIDIVCVVRHNQKLKRGNWHKAAEDGNFFLRGFNYLFIMKKVES